MLQSKSIHPAWLLMATACSVAAHAQLPIDAIDLDTAAAMASGSNQLKLDYIQQRHPDGVRGLTYIAVPEAPVRSGQPADRAEMLRHYACSLAVFGLAELTDSTSFIGKENREVFTKLRFKLVENWQVRPRLQTFDVIVRGGEVVYQGERIRMVHSLANHVQGHRYVMMLGGSRSPTARTFAAEPYFLDAAHGAIAAGLGWSPFESGISLGRAKAMVGTAVAQRGCESGN
jgi:hypothetical protein